MCGKQQPKKHAAKREGSAEKPREKKKQWLEAVAVLSNEDETDGDRARSTSDMMVR